MSEPRLIHPDIIKRVRWLAIVLVVVPLLGLAYAGAHECRGGRIILAKTDPGSVDVTLAMSGSWGSAKIWEGQLAKRPLHVTFARPRGHAYLSLVAADAETGTSSVHNLGYLPAGGGVHYVFVAGTTVSHHEGLMNYDGEADQPSWFDHLASVYFHVVDDLTCVV